MGHRHRIALTVLLALLFIAGMRSCAADQFFISIPGPTLSYVPLYYGQEKGFFAQEGLDLQVLGRARHRRRQQSDVRRDRRHLPRRQRFFRGACAACRSKSFRSRAIGRSTS